MIYIQMNRGIYFLANRSLLFNTCLQKIPVNYSFSGRLVDATHENQGEDDTLEAQCLCCIHVNHLQEWGVSAVFGHILRQG